MRLRSRALAGLALSAALVCATTTAAHAATVISTGHVDVLDIDYSANQLTLQLLDGSTERDPATVQLQVLAGAKTTVPSNSAYSFLGSPGSTVWILPQSQNANLVWAGWNATEVPSGVFQNNKVQVSLTSVTGGDLSVYTTSLGSPSVLFRSGDGLPDTRPVTVGAHTHANWAFSAAGTYSVTFQVSGTLVSDGSTVSTQKTYTFQVQA